jgi:hypothetical protein
MLIVDLEMKVVRQDVNDSMAGGRPPAFSATDRGIGHMMIVQGSPRDRPLDQPTALELGAAFDAPDRLTTLVQAGCLLPRDPSLPT